MSPEFKETLQVAKQAIGVFANGSGSADAIEAKRLWRVLDEAQNAAGHPARELLDLCETLVSMDNPDSPTTALWSIEDWRNARRQHMEALREVLKVLSRR